MSQAHTRKYHRIGEDKRIQIIALYEQNNTMVKICRQTNVALGTVKDIVRKWKQYRTVRDLPRTGRPPKVDDRTRRRLARIMQTGEVKSCTGLAQAATSQEVINISSRTANRELHKAGLKAMHMIKRPMLTRSHKKKRLEFAREHRNWSVDKWKEVIFSDETMIAARPSNLHKLEWTKPTYRLNPMLIIPTVQGDGPTIMTWGCISKYGFHDIILLEGNVDSTGYITVLKDTLIPISQQYFKKCRFIFQQDGASVHTAHGVQEFLKSQNIPVLEWPPHSPDLNIIEHVWHYLKDILLDFPTSNSREELWTNVEKTLVQMWAPEMTMKISKLYESLPNRMRAVIDAHGSNTKY
jgi:transposase